MVRAARLDNQAEMARRIGMATFTGQVLGTGKQVFPPLEAREWIGHDVPACDNTPSANGDNGNPGRAVMEARTSGNRRQKEKCRPTKARYKGRKEAAARRVRGHREKGSGDGKVPRRRGISPNKVTTSRQPLPSLLL